MIITVYSFLKWTRITCLKFLQLFLEAGKYERSGWSPLIECSSGQFGRGRWWFGWRDHASLSVMRLFAGIRCHFLLLWCSPCLDLALSPSNHVGNHLRLIEIVMQDKFMDCLGLAFQLIAKADGIAQILFQLLVPIPILVLEEIRSVCPK